MHAIVDSLSFGGAELLLADMASAFPEAGMRLSVGYLREADGSPAATRLRAAGVDPSLIGIPRHLYPSALWRVIGHLHRVGPDVVHTHLGYADLLGGVAARLLRIPVVSTVHEMSPGSLDNIPRAERIKVALMTWARRRCAARVIAVSGGARTSYLQQTGERPEHVVEVHNGVARRAEPGAGAAVRAELGLPGDALVLATLSTLRPVKAHEVAIEAVALLAEAHPSVRLVVVGEGPSREAVEQAAEPLGDLVTLAGFRDDAMAVLDAVDVLVHPSHLEALPTTLIEAAAAGVPVVATAVGGVPEIVEHGVTGLLVSPPPTASAIADAVEALLTDVRLRERLGHAAAERFARHFSGAVWADNLRGIYVQALQPARRAGGARDPRPNGR